MSSNSAAKRTKTSHSGKSKNKNTSKSQIELEAGDISDEEVYNILHNVDSESDSEVAVNSDEEPLDSEDEVIVCGDEEEEEEAEEAEKIQTENSKAVEKKVYLPGDSLAEGETLVCDDPSVYDTLHEFNVSLPCLSFDIIKETNLKDVDQYPFSVTIVTGSQDPEGKKNMITTSRVTNITRTWKPQKAEDEPSSSSESDSDEDEDGFTSKDPVVFSRSIEHDGAINRIRACPHMPNIVALWSDSGKVRVYDIDEDIKYLEKMTSSKNKKTKGNRGCKDTVQRKPVFESIHGTEGYALDWFSGTFKFKNGADLHSRLATGDNDGVIRVYDQRSRDLKWTQFGNDMTGHTASVEDLQFSPSSPKELISASADKSIRVWHINEEKKLCKLMITVDEAHTADVNVISWNRIQQHLLLSGGDDGVLKVWNLGAMLSGDKQPLVSIKWHKAPITSVEWHPTDDSQLLTTGADDQVSLWDIGTEYDEAGEQALQEETGGVKVPDQLMFVHQGQEDIKEAHWHPQIKDLVFSTALSGFNVFRTST